MIIGDVLRDVIFGDVIIEEHKRDVTIQERDLHVIIGDVIRDVIIEDVTIEGAAAGATLCIMRTALHAPPRSCGPPGARAL